MGWRSVAVVVVSPGGERLPIDAQVVGCVVGGQLARPAAVGADGEHLRVTIAVAGEGELLAVRRPGGKAVAAGVFGEPGGPGPVRAHRVDVVVAVDTVAVERDPPTVGRPVRK